MAVYPGTFDPITNGHLDIISRGSRIFGQVVVAILENPDKSPLLTMKERMSLIRQTTKHLPNVEVESFAGLLADYARSRGAQVIVRGLRAISDFEYEFQMALMNRRLNDDMETVFMTPNESYSYLSSRLVKEVVTLGGSVHGLVPEPVEETIMRHLARGRAGKAPGREIARHISAAPGGEGSAVGAAGTSTGRRRGSGQEKKTRARRGGGR